MATASVPTDAGIPPGWTKEKKGTYWVYHGPNGIIRNVRTKKRAWEIYESSLGIGGGGGEPTAQDALMANAAQQELPPGWSRVDHQAPAGDYRVYHGPQGEKVRSKVKAWDAYCKSHNAAQQEPAIPIPFVHSELAAGNLDVD